LYTTEMTVDEWIKIPDNPRQRDTAKRLCRATHLLKFQPLHSVVYAAQLPDGQKVKLDGHTRAEGWKEGVIPRPPDNKVTVFVVAVPSLDAAAQLYWTFDTPESAKKLRDYLYGALGERGYEIRTLWLQTTVAGALSLIEYGAGRSIRPVLLQAITAWWPEIEWLDSLGYQMPGLFIRNAVTAALLVRSPYQTTRQFLYELPSGGTRINGKSNAIHVLWRYLENKVALKATGGTNASIIAGYTLAAIDGYVEGKMYTTAPKGYDWIKKTTPLRRVNRSE